MSKSVILDGQIIHGSDRFGSWRVHALEGWDQAPESKSISEARPLADGDYDADVFYGSRLVTVNGRLSAKGPEEAFMARARLASLLRSPGLFSVDQFGKQQWATARRGRIAPGKIRGQYLTFQMELRFIDPYKYGETYVTTGTTASPASLMHRGTAQAWPVATITNSTSGTPYTLTLNGKSVTVPAGRFTSTPAHTIDFRTGIFRVGGVVTVGGLSVAEFSPINPGMPQNMTATSTGTPAVSVSYRDTFI